MPVTTRRVLLVISVVRFGPSKEGRVFQEDGGGAGIPHGDKAMSKYVVVNENVLGVFRQGRDASLSYVDVISASILRGANQRPGDSMALPLKRVGDEWTLDNSRIRPATPEDFGTFRTLPPGQFDVTPLCVST